MTTRSSFLAALFLVAIPLLGAKGGCGGDVSLGDDACPTSACGGMPTLACADGSSPFTGKCLAKTDGTCGWEPRACPTPAEECSPCAIPTVACEDGSPGPYSSTCFKQPDGSCAPKFLGCAGAECKTDECGPAPGAPSYTCEDGTMGGPTGRCLRQADAKCGWEIKTCAKKCEPTDCGPPPEIAKCPDGMAPATSCERQVDGACKWDVAPCGMSACAKVETISRKCTSKPDCAVGLQQLNCCGSMRARGYSKSEESAFSSAVVACSASYPACGCPSMPTVDDNDKQGSAFDVDCVSGVCTSFVTKSP